MGLTSWRKTGVSGQLPARAGGILPCQVTSVVSDSATPGTIARQAPLSTGFSRQEDWSGLPCPPPGDLPNLGIKPTSPTSPALTGRFFTASTTWEAPGSFQRSP